MTRSPSPPPSPSTSTFLAACVAAVATLAHACAGSPPVAVVDVPGAATGPVMVISPEPNEADAGVEPRPPMIIHWETSDDAARKRAKERGAPLLVFLFADWSAPAARMDRLAWTDARIVESARSFVMLRLDLSAGDPNAEAAAARHDLRRIPTVAIFDHRGVERARVEGAVEPDELLRAMALVAPAD